MRRYQTGKNRFNNCKNYCKSNKNNLVRFKTNSMTFQVKQTFCQKRTINWPNRISNLQMPTMTMKIKIAFYKKNWEYIKDKSNNRSNIYKIYLINFKTLLKKMSRKKLEKSKEKGRLFLCLRLKFIKLCSLRTKLFLSLKIQKWKRDNFLSMSNKTNNILIRQNKASKRFSSFMVIIQAWTRPKSLIFKAFSKKQIHIIIFLILLKLEKYLTPCTLGEKYLHRDGDI